MNPVESVDSAISVAADRHLEPPRLGALVQPHGVLMVLAEPSLEILQVSHNTLALLGRAPDRLLGQTLDSLLDPFQSDRLKAGLKESNLDYINPSKIWIRKQGDDYAIFDCIFHRNADGLLICEFEPTVSQESIPFLSFYHLAKVSIERLQSGQTLSDFCQTIVHEIRRVTAYDRVMLYKFDEGDRGVVLAEEKLDTMESYLGLHFPESDIPRPAREMLNSNWIRTIVDASIRPVDLVVGTEVSDRPLDLTHSILRSASDCHLEYLHNMGVSASLTISLIAENKLWGIIACHHQTPKYVPYELRKACEFLGRVIFAEISSREETEDYDYRMRLNYIGSALVDAMAQADSFVEGLVQGNPNVLDLAAAGGAAICFGDNIVTVGKTPSREDLKYLVQWLANNVQNEVFTTASLPELYPDAEKYKDIASGLMAISIPKQNYVLWFRPEVIQTVDWGGDPDHAYETREADGKLHLCPRKSFELWKETVSLTSLPWKSVEVKAALELRKALINIVLRQADELAQLARDLERSNAELKKFAYVASHDLQEPLNQVANYVQLLEMRYGDRLDGDASEFINFAVEGVSLMQTLIDDVLAYSRVDTQGAEFELASTEAALEKALNNLRGRVRESRAKVTYDPLPTVLADSMQLMQLFLNLIGNAIKFRSDRAPEIHIGAERQDDRWLFWVRDNGIGLDPQFGERIFVIFQRLHARDEYPGTGMGLAICKKIIECHRGKIWVESQPGEGATFFFTLPIGGRDRERRTARKVQNHLIGGGQQG